MKAGDREILRTLAKEYLDVCKTPRQAELRALWRRHQSLKGDRPLIYVRAFAWEEMPQARCQCEDPFFRRFEDFFRNRLFLAAVKDDSIFEPWVTLEASHKCSDWGVQVERHLPGEAGGAFKVNYPIRELDDIEKLRLPRHEIDEAKTALELGRLQEAIGDIITIDVDRSAFFQRWANGDLSTTLGYLRGIENFMMDMVDNPEWLHRLMKFMSDGILRAQEQAEAAGDLGLSAHGNQSMTYAGELPDPAANSRRARRSQLWNFVAAQEFTTVSPAMHDEFLLQYQLPILKKFGLVAYGCCEDLTRKIGMLRKIPNLRRIAVSPFADVGRCAEQIGRDFVLSYRPSPADMVSYGFDADRIRRILRRDMALCRACHFDITLKDVETVQRDPTRVASWVELTRGVIDEVCG